MLYGWEGNCEPGKNSNRTLPPGVRSVAKALPPPPGKTKRSLLLACRQQPARHLQAAQGNNASSLPRFIQNGVR